MQVVTENSSLIDLYITHKKKKKMANICSSKFLGVTLDNTLTWKAYRYGYSKTEFSIVEE